MKKAKMEDIIDRLHHIRMGLLSTSTPHEINLATLIEEIVVCIKGAIAEASPTRKALESLFV